MSQWRIFEHCKEIQIADLEKIPMTQNDIKAELFTNEPMIAGFKPHMDFMQYKGGIYMVTSPTHLMNHAVVIVGYGIENGQKFWRVQNSMGYFGEQGYVRIGEGQAGIKNMVYVDVPLI